MADLSDDDYDAIASQVAQRLDTGRYGSRFVLSRRQLLSIAGGSAGVAGLVALGVDPATAQSAAGQVGTQSSPEDVFAYDLDVQNGAEFNGTDLSGVGSFSTEAIEPADFNNVIVDLAGGSVRKSGLLYKINNGGINDSKLIELDGSNSYHVRATAVGANESSTGGVYLSAYWDAGIGEIYEVHNVRNNDGGDDQGYVTSVSNGNFVLSNKGSMRTGFQSVIWVTIG